MNIQSPIQNRRSVISEPQGTSYRRFLLVCLVSFFCHILLFVSLFFFNDFKFFAPKPKVVTVDLVAFAPGPADTQTSGKSSIPAEPTSDGAEAANLDTVSQNAPQATEATEPKEPEIQTIKPDVSLKSKPKNLKDLIAAREKKPPKEEPPKEKPPEKKQPKEDLAEKKKKQEAIAKKKLEQDLAKAKKEQAEKREKQRQAELKNALERMKASVASKENGAGSSNSIGYGEEGVAGGGGNGQASPLTLYQMVIKSAIEQNWVFNDAMAGLNKDLEVRIFIKILKSGDIRDISFETRSGNNYLDESAKKAVQRANPLPELPKGMFSYELVLGFSPRGLK